jgi:hypothetical protein
MFPTGYSHYTNKKLKFLLKFIYIFKEVLIMKLENLSKDNKVFGTIGFEEGVHQNIRVYFEQPTQKSEKFDINYALFVKYESTEGRKAQGLLGLPDKNGTTVGINLRAWLGAYVAQHKELEGSSEIDLVTKLLNKNHNLPNVTLYVQNNVTEDGRTYINYSLRPFAPKIEVVEQETFIEDNPLD